MKEKKSVHLAAYTSGNVVELITTKEKRKSSAFISYAVNQSEEYTRLLEALKRKTSCIHTVTILFEIINSSKNILCNRR